MPLILWPAVVWLAMHWIVDRPPPPLTGRIDHILIDKSDRLLTVYRGGLPLRRYVIRLGFAPDGDKERQGDGRTPEGLFTIDRRNAHSRFHLSLGLDYPQPADIARAAAAGYSPGGDIFIHGQPRGVEGWFMVPADWTAGCIAVTNRAMDEIWRVAATGTTVEIVP